MADRSDRTSTRTTSTGAVVGEVVSPRERRELDGRKVITRLLAVIMRGPRYVTLGWRLMKDPTVSPAGKAALGGGLAYAISPIDPVPGFIPVLGQLDDLAALLLGVRMALRSAPAEVAEGHLREVGLSWATVDGDIVTIRATAVWIARRGGALALRVGRALLGAAGRRLKSAITGHEPEALDTRR
jgi:uncharacterized membrane protein YkvA (DUF1232 family)